jgi:voltage-gated potassium channel
VIPSVPLILLLLGALMGLALALRRQIGQQRLYEIIFEADTKAGRRFDLLLLVVIVSSVITALLESDPRTRQLHRGQFQILEWIFSMLFSLEYFLRLLCVEVPRRYAFSFFGIVDLLASLPTLFSLVLPASKYFSLVRVLRLLRVFRVLELGAYLQESDLLWQAIVASRRKILVFFLTMVTLVILIGTVMYQLEGEKAGFVSIPTGIYWAIVTITTVGYGDVTPLTPLGRLLASLVMLLGYSIIAVPTGIISAELGEASRLRHPSTDACPACNREGHDADARHCKYCGAGL